MEPQRRDLAYNAYLKEHPGGNFTRFSQLSQAGKRSYGDPTAHAVRELPAVNPSAPRRGPADPVRADGQAGRRVAVGGTLKELRRKIAWAVGTFYGVPYTHYDTWPAEYARRAAERLVEIHGEP